MSELLKFSGEALRLRRKRTDKTQSEIAELIGITPQSYGEMERGQIAPSAANLTKICIVFGASPDEFFPGLRKNFAEI